MSKKITSNFRDNNCLYLVIIVCMLLCIYKSDKGTHNGHSGVFEGVLNKMQLCPFHSYIMKDIYTICK